MSDLRSDLRCWTYSWDGSRLRDDDVLAPGLPPLQVAAALAAEGLPAAADVVTWFAWHDGQAAPLPLVPLAPSRHHPLSLAEALRARRRLLAAARGTPGTPAPGRGTAAWDPSWLPLGEDGAGGVLAVELVGDTARTGPVRSVDPGDPGTLVPAAADLREAVHRWTAAAATGSWRWDADAQRWDAPYGVAGHLLGWPLVDDPRDADPPRTVPRALVAWEAAWAERGCPVDRVLAPGLPPAQVAAALAGAGLPAAADAADVVAWFSWHDGSAPGAARTALAPSRHAPLGLAAALELRARRLDAAVHAARQGPAGRDAAFYWEPDWLPLGDDGQGGVLVVELGTDVTGTGPVRRVDWTRGPTRTPAALTLREAVWVWREALATGAWDWDGDARAWAFDPARLPARLRHPLLE